MPLLTPNWVPITLLVPTLIVPLAHASENDTGSQKTANKTKPTETMVVVASRNELALSDVAGSVAVVTSKDLEKQMANSIEDSLRYIPGVSMNGNARFGASDFNVRGIEGSRIKVLIDGVEQPVSYGSGISGTVMNVLGKGQGQVEVDTLTAIEVNKGASSSLYGSGALGGSVLMRTKTADDLLNGKTDHASVDAGYQSRDSSYKTTINAARQFNDSLKGMVIFTHRDGNELQTHNDGADVIGENRGQADPLNATSNNVLSKLEFQANENNQWVITGQYFEKNSDGKGLSLENTSSGFYSYSNYRYEDTQRRARAGIKHIWAAHTPLFDHLTWQANWQTSEAKNSTYDTRTSAFPPNNSLDRTRQRNAKDTSTQLDIQFDKTFALGASNHDFIYGATLVDSEFKLETRDTDSSGSDTSGVVEMPPKTDVQKIGIFAQDQIYLLEDRLIVTAGLRYDMFQYRPTEDPQSIPGNIGEYKNHDSDAVTGQFGGVFHFNEITSAYAKYAYSFKAPTPEELYYSFERNPIPNMKVIILANPDLKPETSNSIEIGVRQNHSAFNWELAGYYNDYNDFINSVSWTEIRNGARYMYSKNENIDNARIYGAELSSALQLGSVTSLPTGTYLRLTGAWSKGEDKDTDKAIDTIAPLTGVLGLGYDRIDGSYGWEATITAVASKDGNDWSDEKNLTAPGYGILDITAYAHPIKDLTIRGGVFNLLNKKYWSYSRLNGLTESSVSNLDSISSAGINFGLNAKYEF